MAVIIKKMNMPTSCGDCQLRSNGYCGITDRLIPYDGSIHGDCPLIEIPKGSRLIDSNKMKNKIDGCNYRVIFEIKKWIDVQPIVFEEEEND